MSHLWDLSGSDGHSIHLAALRRAVPAGFRAALAVLGLVLLALGCADIARLRADPTDLGRQAGPSAHEACARPTHIGAVDAEPRAIGHLPQASISAVLAFLCAPDASIDAGLVFLMGHGSHLFDLQCRCSPGPSDPGW
jgi:hypothetical protein